MPKNKKGNNEDRERVTKISSQGKWTTKERTREEKWWIDGLDYDDDEETNKVKTVRWDRWTKNQMVLDNIEARSEVGNLLPTWQVGPAWFPILHITPI